MRSRIMAGAAAVAVVALLAQALAASGSPGGPRVAATLTGRGITQVKVVKDAGPVSTTSNNWTTLASTSVTVPASTQALILARFSAISTCTTTTGSNGLCFARIRIGGVTATPSGFNIFDDDNDDPVVDTFEANSMDRSLGPLGPGTYTVAIQIRTSTGPSNTTFMAVRDYSLTVERVQA
jgi:hypothetical protein